MDRREVDRDTVVTTEHHLSGAMGSASGGLARAARVGSSEQDTGKLRLPMARWVMMEITGQPYAMVCPCCGAFGDRSYVFGA